MIFPVLFYHGEVHWKYSASFSALLDYQNLTNDEVAEWQQYTPNFSYHLCDLSALDEMEIRGQSVMRATLLLMKNIHRLHEAPRLLQVWQAFGKLSNQSAVQYIRVMLKYASEANTTLSKEAVLHSIKQAFARQGEKVMAPFVQEWIREGEQRGMQKGIQQGMQQGFMEMTLRLLEKRVGRVTKMQKKTITALPIPKLTQLGEDLLDFQSAKDLKLWLQQNVG